MIEPATDFMALVCAEEPTRLTERPTFTAGHAAFGADECIRITQLQQVLDATEPIRRPITAIFTRNDTVVDWRACIDRTSPSVRMVEVGSTHVGLGFDPDVWLIVADALAEKDNV